MIDALLAKKFIERITQYTEYNVNIMDEKGIIIASKNTSRIGTFHEVALQIIQLSLIHIYGKEMPDSPDDFEPDWLSYCTKENIGVIYRAIKEVRAEVPMILYLSLIHI